MRLGANRCAISSVTQAHARGALFQLDTLKPALRVAMYALMVLACASLHADPVQMTVTVKDPDGNPVPGAGVQYFFESDGEPIPVNPLITDATGQITAVINTPAPPSYSRNYNYGLWSCRWRDIRTDDAPMARTTSDMAISGARRHLSDQSGPGRTVDRSCCDSDSRIDRCRSAWGGASTCDWFRVVGDAVRSGWCAGWILLISSATQLPSLVHHRGILRHSGAPSASRSSRCADG